MEVQTLRKFENNGLKHIVYRGVGSEVRWENGIIVLVGEESTVFETVRGDEIAIRNEDFIRVERWRPKPEGGRPRDEGWRDLYNSHSVSVDCEPEDPECKEGDSDG